ncbi:serine hydrolase [Sphingomonas colocasiae]|uniref:Class A beta-lactamase-related serine hydrolase n=1 Tax=Sphingomonas colocasiae TaxID=1848973 RepID=A0ABS7PRU0_9SPHN|nr:serine hydrolase [Sphingomonas colocasiae]MBY8822719.1 class A beta-lactamase-related serine hydrolase [Sphingomonas colocasiae]
MRIVAALLMLFAALAPAQAQGDPDVALRARAAELPAILSGRADATTYFSPVFFSDVPMARFTAIARSLIDQNGPVLRIQKIVPEGNGIGTVQVGYERAVVTIRLVVERDPPYRVGGFLVTGSQARDDSLGKLLDDVKALPGSSAFAIAELGDGPPRWILQHNPDRQMAVGSAYKLYILGEIARQIAAGEHRWDEVARLGAASLPSGITQRWPKASPLTIHSLATLMISLSDNTATDTLLDIAGREKVGAYLRDTGHAAPDKALPILKTAEAFSLKMPANAALRDRWIKGDADQRARLLETAAADLVIERIDFAKLGSMPLHIDTVEWFASPADTTAVFDRLRKTAGPDALAILGVSPGVDALTAARFDYIGFKGGSEAGVISLNYLLRDKRGRWFAVTGAWNTARDVEGPRFNGLMVRALALVGR